MAQVRRWCFTLFNYNTAPGYYVDYFSNPGFKIKRAVWGYERSPDSGNPHLQGYAEFERSMRFSYVKTILNTAHWEVARESSLHNFRYATKSGTYHMTGDWALEQSGQAAKNGAQAPTGLVVEALLSTEHCETVY